MSGTSYRIVLSPRLRPLSRSASLSASCRGGTRVNTENFFKHLRVLWRTDKIIADIRMRHLLAGLGLRAFAALIAAFGLLMLELSAYFALVQIWSAISAAAVLGAANFAIAALLFAIAARQPSGRELELANEIHGSSVEALEREARALQSQMSGAIHH